jgi:hemerythrin superfamily protein
VSACLENDHRAIDLILGDVEALISEGELGQAAMRSEHAARTLGSHNVKEERVLYPRTDEGLDSFQRDDLVARIELLIG